jgi:hypothetical protein
MTTKADQKAGTGEPLDKVLDSLTILHARMDALETETKNPIKEGEDDDDDDRKDATAEEEGEEEGKVPPVVADKKRKDDSKRKDGDLELKHEGGEVIQKADKKRKDSKRGDDDDDRKAAAHCADDYDDDDDDRKDAWGDDDDDDDKRKDSRADSATVRALKKRLAELERKVRPISDEEHSAFADAQSRADSIFNGFGKRAPRPLEGESLLNYRKRLAGHLKTYSDSWKGIKLTQLPDAAFDVAERQIYADSERAAASPVDLGEGELRAVTRQDATTGQRTTVFYGKDSFVKSMGRPSRRVRGFRISSGN